jgi:hypothetical protein
MQRQHCLPSAVTRLVAFTTQLTSIARRAVRHGRDCFPVAVLCVVAGLIAGCREPFDALGGKVRPTDARARAEQLFAALGARVTEPLRDPKYDSARVRIANAAFLPSRVWDDSAVWTAFANPRRSLQVGGQFTEGRYRLEATSSAPTPARVAESRHVINLTRLSNAEYAWDTDVVYAIGTVKASDIGAFFGALIASAEGRGERELRDDYRVTAPRSSAVLGQLFSVDSIRIAQLPDRSTLATYALSMTPAGVEQRYPNFAKYMRRYAQTARLHLTLADGTGARFLDCSALDGQILFRVRTLGGKMVPIAGPSRSMPDSMTLSGGLTMRVRRFNVGFRNYHADFAIDRSDRERAWTIVSRREPEWVLPLITERLLRTPLRRPFQGSGAFFRIGVRDDSAGGQTILYRRAHLEVQESLILRFIGRLGSIAVNEYTGRVEREQAAWLREVFEAVVADVRAGGL